MIQRVVCAANTGSARSRQRSIGPSAIGEECVRLVGYLAYGMEPVNTGTDPWLAIVGTAVHAWLAEAFEADNKRQGRRRWLVEEKVHVTDAIAGRCDLYGFENATAIDFKVLGNDRMRRIKTGGPGQRYRTQVHLYGYGLARAGHRVEHVALACFPRGGLLDGLYVWTEPYDERVAKAALDRLAAIIELAARLEVEDHPDRWGHIPATAGPHCVWCPFFRPGQPPSADGCPGDDNIWNTVSRWP